MNVNDIQGLLDSTATIETRITILPLGDEEPIVLTQDDSIESWDYENNRVVPDNGFIGQFVARTLDGSLSNLPSNFAIENREIFLELGIRRYFETYDNIATEDNKDIQTEDSKDMTLDQPTGHWETTYYPMGNFIIEKPENDDVNDVINFKSSDYTMKFNISFNGDFKDYEFTSSFNERIESHNYPTLSWLAEYTCKQAGVELATSTFTNSTMLITDNQFVEGDQCRDVMKEIAKVAFSWVRIDIDNRVYIDFVKKTSVEKDYNNITTDNYYSLKIQNEIYGAINSVIFGSSIIEGDNSFVEDEQSVSEIGVKQLKINDPKILHDSDKRDEAIKKGNVLFGLQYQPLEIETTGHPWLKNNDLISVTDTYGNVLYTYPLNIKISYNGHIRTTLSSPTSTDVEKAMTYKGDNKVTTLIKKTKIDVDKANQRIDLLVSETDEYENKFAQINLSLDGITQTITDTKNEIDGEYTEKFAQINLSLDGINSTISNTKKDITDELSNYVKDGDLATVRESVTNLQTSNSQTISIVNELMVNGVSQVKTENNYEFSKDGLKINDSNSPNNVVINNTGIKSLSYDKLEAIFNYKGSGIRKLIVTDEAQIGYHKIIKNTVNIGGSSENVTQYFYLDTLIEDLDSMEVDN